jgi:hypothetical protein
LIENQKNLAIAKGASIGHLIRLVVLLSGAYTAKLRFLLAEVILLTPKRQTSLFYLLLVL